MRETRLNRGTGGASPAALRAASRAGLSLYRGLVPGAGRGAGPIGTLVTGQLGGTNRIFCPVYDSTSDQAVLPLYGNFYGTGDGATPNAITLAAAVEVGGTLVSFTFGGALTVSLAGGATILPDNPITVPLVTASYGTNAGTGTVKGFWLRTYISVTSGQSYPGNIVVGNPLVSGEVDGMSVAGGANLTVAGSGSVTAGGGNSYTFGPQLVLTGSKSHRLFGYFGDSITNGQGDVPNNFGHVERAAIATGIPILKMARPGETVSNFQAAGNRCRRATFFEGLTDVFFGYGINDLNNRSRTVAQVQTDLSTMFAVFASKNIRVHMATIGPRVTSANGFIDLAGQSGTGTSGSALISDIAEINDWIRGLPTGVYGVFDHADALMSSRNSGKWKFDGTSNKYTSDGTHPNHVAYQNLLTPALVSYLNAYRSGPDW